METSKLVLFTRALGAIGMLFPITANFIPPSDTRAMCFVIGCILMFIAAAVERELFFSMLQLIVLSGAGMHFAPVSDTIKAAVPITFMVLTLLYFTYTGRMSDKLTLFGSAGIAILSMGYAEANPYIYLTGGFILAVYSTISYLRGVTVAILWSILNIFFTFAALYNIYNFS